MLTRVLLDECVPKRLRKEFADHAVKTVAEMGWSGLTNGELLRQAATEFDCFLAVDRNLQFQQSRSELPIAVLVLVARSNRYETLADILPQAREALATMQPKELRTVGV